MGTSNKPSTLNWPRSDQLLEFVHLLKQDGYNVGISHYLAAQELLLALIASGSDPSDFPDLLGPLLCSSEADQSEFGDRYRSWWTSVNQPQPPVDPYQPELGATNNDNPISARLRRWLPAIVGFLAVFVISILIYSAYQIFLAPTIEPTPQATPIVLSTPEPTPIQTDQPTTQTTLSPIPLDETIREPFNTPLWLGLGALSVPLFFFAWLAVRSGQTSALLSRHRFLGTPELERVLIRIKELEGEFFPNLLLVRLARGLRRRYRIDTTQLNAEQTVSNTIANAGWFTPAYKSQLIVPEYLVFIDSNSIEDHQARRVEETLDRLAHNGVFLEKYFFNGDPRLCLEKESGRLQKLTEILRTHPQQRILVFADAEIFFSALTAKLEPWVELFSTGNQRCLITPEPKDEWGYFEDSIVHIFEVIPASLEGWETYVRNGKHDNASRTDTGYVHRFPEMLRDRPLRWIDPVAPEADRVEDMFEALNEYLGEQGMLWLGACAIYPKLDWRMTLFLGRVQANETQSASVNSELLSRLSRLPWFRYGYMPDWMRTEAIAELSDPQEKMVRKTFDDLIHYEVESSTLPEKQNLLFLDYVKSVQDLSGDFERLSEPLRDKLRDKAIPESAWQDGLFFDFMKGRVRRDLAVRVKTKSRRDLSTQYWKRRQVLKWGATICAGMGVALLTRVGLTSDVTYRVVTLHLLGNLSAGQFSPNGRSLLLLGENTFHEWDLVSKTYAPDSLKLERESSSERLIDVSPNGQTLISTSQDGTNINLWTSDGTLLAELPVEYAGERSLVEFSPDSRTLATASADETVRIWVLSSGDERTRFSFDALANSFAFSPDGQKIATAGSERTVRVWDAGSGEEIERTSLDESVNFIAFSPDGKQIATANLEGTVLIWNVSLGVDIPVSFKSEIMITDIAFSPGSQTLAISTESGVQLWNFVTQDVDEIRINLSNPIQEIGFSPDGSMLLVLSAGNLTLLDLDGEVVKDFSSVDYEVKKLRNVMRQVELGNDVQLDMMQIPPGKFQRGSPDTEVDREEVEGPLSNVTIARSFWMGRYPITQEQWRVIASTAPVDIELNPDPSSFKGDDRPVENVSWFEAVEFCKRLSREMGKEFRLPSEAEWEYACRAGTTTPFHFGETITTRVANYDGTIAYDGGPEGIYVAETTPVGSFRLANAFGLSDMHGNVWEWCEDFWHPNYEGAPSGGTPWIEGGDQSLRVVRGGSWINYPRGCRSAVRNRYLPDLQNDAIGFRVVCASPRLS